MKRPGTVCTPRSLGVAETRPLMSETCRWLHVAHAPSYGRFYDESSWLRGSTLYRVQVRGTANLVLLETFLRAEETVIHDRLEGTRAVQSAGLVLTVYS